MTDRTRQLGASTTAPHVSEPCTECRGFFNVPQMRRGRWAAGVCHACGGAGTRDAQVGRVLPAWDARGWIDTPYPEPAGLFGAVDWNALARGRCALLDAATPEHQPCTGCNGYGRIEEPRLDYHGPYTVDRECEHCDGDGRARPQPTPPTHPEQTDDDLHARIVASLARAAAAAAFDVRAGEIATHPPTLLDQVREAVPSRGWDRTPTGGACTRIAGDTLSVDHDPARGGYLVKLWPTGVMGCIGDLGELPAMLRLMADAPDVSDAVLAANLRALAMPPEGCRPHAAIPLIDAVRESAPMFRWSPYPGRPDVAAHLGDITIEASKAADGLRVTLHAGMSRIGSICGQTDDLPNAIRELVRPKSCPPDVRARVLDRLVR